MLRIVSIFVVLVSFASVALGGQGQVVSYYTESVSPGEAVIIPQIPSQGFILTDLLAEVAAGQGSIIVVNIYERQNNVDTFKARLRQGDYGTMVVSLQSGIPFAAGSSLVLSLPTATPGYHVTVSGYIPALTGNVPAVSVWGLMVLGLLIVIAGTIAVSKRKPVA